MTIKQLKNEVETYYNNQIEIIYTIKELDYYDFNLRLFNRERYDNLLDYKKRLEREQYEILDRIKDEKLRKIKKSI